MDNSNKQTETNIGNKNEDKNKPLNESERINFYQYELKVCREKLKGYEVLSSLYKISIDECKSHQAQIKDLEKKLEYLERKINYSEVKFVKSHATEILENVKNPELFKLKIESQIGNANSGGSVDPNIESVESFTTVVNVRPRDEKTLNEFSKWALAYDDHSKKGGDKDVDGAREDVDDERNEVKDENSLGGFELLKKDSSFSKEKNAFKLSLSSSDTSFVKINDSQIQDDDDDDDDDDDKEEEEEDDDDDDVCQENYHLTSKDINSSGGEKEKIKLGLKRDMERFLNIMRGENPLNESGTLEKPKNLLENLENLMKRMFRLYKQTQLMQSIMENMEKENKQLKVQLSSRPGERSHIEAKKCDEGESNETVHHQEMIDNLLSCKQALLEMIGRKDQQLAHAKQRVSILKTKSSQAKINYNKVAICLHHNTKRWQRDYNKLEEEMIKVKGERDRERKNSATLEKECAHLKLKVNRKPCENTKLDAHEDRDKTTEIEILKQQVAVYAEDFNNERRDREKAQATVQSLEKDLEQAKCSNQSLSRSYSKLKDEYKKLEDEKRLKQVVPINPLETPLSGLHYNIPLMSHPSAPSDEPFNQSTVWKCKTCTLINSEQSNYCTTCFSRRF